MFEFLKKLNCNSTQISDDNSTQIDMQCDGNNVIISNGKVIVDGATVAKYGNQDTKVIVNGNVNILRCAGSVEIHGDSGSIDCGGSCTVGGNVNGKIDASGSITCSNVSGNIDASGSINCRRI